MRAVGCTVRICAATIPELLVAVIRDIQFIYVGTITFVRSVKRKSRGWMSAITRETYYSIEDTQERYRLDLCMGLDSSCWNPGHSRWTLTGKRCPTAQRSN
jgi:hypothetical protein